MRENIKPISIPKDGEEIVYTLEDKDYLFIVAIKDLTEQIKLLRMNK